MIERRAFLRLEDSLPVKYTRAAKSIKDAELKEITRMNIGGGGIKLILEENLPEGTILAMHISIPDPDEGFIPIFATGEVAWSETVKEGKKYGVGIKFINIEEEDRYKIIKYVESKISDEK